jgi:hypothetical protein
VPGKSGAVGPEEYSVHGVIYVSLTGGELLVDAYPGSDSAPRFPTGAPVVGAVFSTGAIRRPALRPLATDSPESAIRPFANRRHRGIAVCYRPAPIACAGTTGVVGELYRSGIQLTGVARAKYQAASRNIASPFSTPRADLPAIGSRACTLVLRVARCGNVIRSPGNPHPAPDTGKVRRRCGRLSELSATCHCRLRANRGTTSWNMVS